MRNRSKIASWNRQANVCVGDRGGIRLRGAGALFGVYLVSADSLLKLTTQIRRISSDGGFAEFFVVGADRKKSLKGN
jgi:hypothetical protein